MPSQISPTPQPANPEFFYPEDDIGYQAPEALERWRNPNYTPDNSAPTTPPPKQSLLSKLFHRPSR